MWTGLHNLCSSIEQSQKLKARCQWIKSSKIQLYIWKIYANVTEHCQIYFNAIHLNPRHVTWPQVVCCQPFWVLSVSAPISYMKHWSVFCAAYFKIYNLLKNSLYLLSLDDDGSLQVHWLYATWGWDEWGGFFTDNYGLATCPRLLRSGLM